MSKVVVKGFSVSIDGFGAGPNQSEENPLGVDGPKLFQWFFPTNAFLKMHGSGETGTTGIDNDFAEASAKNIGAYIMGRNMFGPVRGAWPNDEWKGWWGPNPPYHTPVFVLTHHKREPLKMEGGTTFYFVTDGIETAMKKAKEAAGTKDIKIAGGVSTIRQYLQKGLIDELHLAASPVLMGNGENLFAGLDLAKLGYEVVSTTAGEKATHVLISKKVG